jgi:zinc transporter ZupT
MGNLLAIGRFSSSVLLDLTQIEFTSFFSCNYEVLIFLHLVAGVMVFISLNELYPSAIQYCKSGASFDVGKNRAMFWLTLGMVVGFFVMSLFQH